jgi:RimJ/RimL family protein N-acetyltransferase
VRPPEPPLSDGVITLRPWRDADLPAVLALWSEPEVQRWTLQPVPFRERDAQLYLRQSAEGWHAGRAARFAVTVAEEALGVVSLRLYQHRIAEVAYAFLPRAWGRGLATRAVGLISSWALDEVGVSRIELLTHPDNVASQRVAEKAGYTREGILREAREQRGRRFDCVCFSLLASDPRPAATSLPDMSGV